MSNDDDNEIMTCPICGARVTIDELCDHLPDECDGTGFIECECGWDHLCVCCNHGGAECFGCDRCEVEDEYDD